jgi:hypothetical protein
MRGPPLRWLAASTAVIAAAAVTTAVVLHRSSDASADSCPAPTFESAVVASGPPGTVVFDLPLSTCSIDFDLPAPAATAELVVLGYGDTIAVYDRRTGQPKWHRDLAGTDSRPDDPMDIQLVGDTVVAQWSHQTPRAAQLSGWDLMTGEPRFDPIHGRQPFEVVNDLALTADDAMLYAYTIRSGREAWRRPLDINFHSFVWNTAGTLAYVDDQNAAGPRHQIRRIDVSTGRTLAPLRTTFDIDAVYGASGRTVVVSTAAGALIGLDATRGRSVWKRSSDQSILLTSAGWRVNSWVAPEARDQRWEAVDLDTGRAYPGLPPLPRSFGGVAFGAVLSSATAGPGGKLDVFDLADHDLRGTYTSRRTSLVLAPTTGHPVSDAQATAGLRTCDLTSTPAPHCNGPHLVIMQL